MSLLLALVLGLAGAIGCRLTQVLCHIVSEAQQTVHLGIEVGVNAFVIHLHVLVDQ